MSARRIMTVLAVLLAAGCGGGSSTGQETGNLCARTSLNSASGTIGIAGCTGDVSLSVSDELYTGLGQLASYSFTLQCGSTRHTGRVTRIDWVNNQVACFDAVVDGTTCDSCAPIVDAGAPDAAPPREECAAIELNFYTPTSVAWSPDGTRLATGIYQDSTRLWQLPAGNLLTELDSTAFGVAFSPDGRVLATADTAGTVELWDVTSFAHLGSLAGHYALVTSVTWSTDGARIASGSWDHTARLWDVAARSELRTFTGHSDWVNGVALSPDGARLATASQDGSVVVWDTATGNTVWSATPDPGSGVASVAFSPDGTLLASGGDSVRLWGAADGHPVRTVVGPEIVALFRVAFFPDGTRLATAAYSGLTVDIWRVADGSLVRSFQGHTASITGLAVSSDGTKIATTSEDETIRLWCP